MDTANLPVCDAVETISHRMKTANVPVSVTNTNSKNPHTNIGKKVIRLTFPLAWNSHTDAIAAELLPEPPWTKVTFVTTCKTFRESFGEASQIFSKGHVETSNMLLSNGTLRNNSLCSRKF